MPGEEQFGLGVNFSRPMGFSSYKAGLSNPFCEGSSSPFSSAHTLQVIPSQFPQVSSFRRRGRIYVDEGSDRGSLPAFDSGVLCDHVSGSKRGAWDRLETSFRSNTIKSICQEGKIQNGDTQVSVVGNQASRLDGYGRFEGRLFPGTHASPLFQVPQVCLEQKDFSVQGPLLWPFDSPSGVYARLRSGSIFPPSEECASLEVPRRLVTSSLVPPGVCNSLGNAVIPVLPSGHQSKSKEILSQPSSGSNLSRHEDFFTKFQGLSQGEKGDKIQVKCTQVIRKVSPGQAGRISPRPDVLSHRFSKGESVEDEAISFSSARGKVKESEGVEHFNTIQGLQGGHFMVDSTSASRDGYLSCSIGARHVSGDGCISRGLGLSCGGLQEFRDLVGRGVSSSHKHFGIKSSHVCPSGSSPLSTGQGDSSSGGQHNSASISQTRRWNEIEELSSGSSQDPDMGRNSSGVPGTEIHSGLPKCGGGLSFESVRVKFHGVVPEQISDRTPLDTLGSSSGGRLCHSIQPPVAGILLPSSGSSCIGDRRYDPELVAPRSISISTHEIDQEGSIQIQRFGRSKGNTCSPTVAPTGMVPRPAESVDRSTETSPSLNRSIISRSKRSRVPPLRYYEFARVEAIQHLLRERKFSRDAASYISECNRASTLKVYEAKWRKFSDWCYREKVHPLRPPLEKLVNFYLFVKNDLGLSVSAIEGYRAALAPIFKLAGCDYGESTELSLLFKAFKRSFTRSKNRPPHWDINVVLLSLKLAPYEPFLEDNLNYVTMKTLFLVAFATANRVSELHALSDQVGFGRDGSVVLCFSPLFIAKSETLNNSVRREFRIESLSSITDDQDELLLCPVRAIKKYLFLTRHSSRAKSLFVSPRDPTRPLSANACAYFLRSTISYAYEHMSDKTKTLSRVNAHEVRAVAVSIRFRFNLSQINLIKSAYWRSNSMFCSRYLRDISHSYTDVSALGPLVVAQGIVQA